jgi:hypothetical protein
LLGFVPIGKEQKMARSFFSWVLDYVVFHCFVGVSRSVRAACGPLGYYGPPGTAEGGYFL